MIHPAYLEYSKDVYEKEICLHSSNSVSYGGIGKHVDKKTRSAGAAAGAPMQYGPMSEKLFKRLSEFIYNQVGIELPPTKRTMIEARLQKRLRALRMPSYKDYFDFLFSPQGLESELVDLIDVVTTNTTDFFREPQHFKHMSQTLLPEYSRSEERYKRLRVWSAGCSIGMEPYTLAMVLEDFREQTPAFNFSIMATDISTQALKQAQRAIYDEDRLSPVPEHMKKKYLMRSKDKNKKLVRIAPELRNTITFRRLNFMEQFTFPEPMNIIFCRNVVIYFDKSTQEQLFNKFCRCLRPGGFLFIGHSESLAGFTLPLEQVIPTVYRRT